ncbi:MAG: hypothetical protein AAF938_20325, partial [Myxococcota bacterium]
MRARFAFLLMACGTDPVQLDVDLRTDFVPEVEFTGVQTALEREGAIVGEATREADAAANYVVGARVASFEDLRTGEYTISVRLLSRDATPVATRRISLRVGGNAASVILATRDCAGAVCPSTGDPDDATECFAGQCVTTGCSLANPEECGPSECALDADCAFAAACVSGACFAGACLAQPNDAVCDTGEFCLPEEGCRPVEGSCIPDAPCDPGVDCRAGAIDCSGDEPACSPTDPAPAGTACSAGFCDADGGCGACPQGEPCMIAERCEAGEIDCSTGSPMCAATGPIEAGIECRPSAGPCDEAEVCDGVTMACPFDALPLTDCDTAFRDAGEFAYTVPVGCTRLEADLWGAGGGSGAGNSSGAGGGYAGGALDVSPGDMFAVVVASPGENVMGGGGGSGGVPGGGGGGDGRSRLGGGGGG